MWPLHRDEAPWAAVTCAVCGNPLMDQDFTGRRFSKFFPSEKLLWMTRLTLVRPDAAANAANAPPKQNGVSQENDRFNDTALEYIQCKLHHQHTNGRFIRVFPDGTRTRLEIDTSLDVRDQLIIPLHRGCLALAMQFCKYRSRFSSNSHAPDGGEPSTMSHLYEIWKQRIIKSDTWLTKTGIGGTLKDPILEPHGYFGAISHESLYDYHGAIGKGWTDYNEKFLSAPNWVKDITNFIVVRYLRRIPAGEEHPRPEHASLKACLDRLPGEVHDMCVSHLGPFVDESPECTRLLPPICWRYALFEGRILPWLYDLDINVVRSPRIAAGVDPDDESGWDWEGLVRKLSRSDILRNSIGVHGALCNRQRIWQLLSCSRLGDVKAEPSNTESAA